MMVGKHKNHDPFVYPTKCLEMNMNFITSSTNHTNERMSMQLGE
jgi:hypothetical protein